MTKVLILTKSILNEQTFQKKLQELNHEVYCSVSFFKEDNKKQPDKTIINFFDTLIVSETLNRAESERVLSILEPNGIAVIRKCDAIPSKSEEREWQLLGITNWVRRDESMEGLREFFEMIKHKFSKKLYVETKVRPPSVSFRNVHLSQREQMLLKYLFYSKSVVLDRDQLCRKIWGEKETTNSNLSQLSALVNRVKRKFETILPESEIIETHWGRGYSLSEEGMTVIPTLFEGEND